MFYKIKNCPFCGSDQLLLEKWLEGYSHYCRSCKSDFRVNFSDHKTMHYYTHLDFEDTSPEEFTSTELTNKSKNIPPRPASNRLSTSKKRRNNRKRKRKKKSKRR